MYARWWEAIRPELWRFAADGDGRKVAVLAVMLDVGMSRPPVSLHELQVLVTRDGGVEHLSLEVLRDLLDDLQRHGMVVPYRDWTNGASEYGEGRRRKESWALTKEGRHTVRGVRDATARYAESAKLPLRLLEAVAEALRRIRAHIGAEPEKLFADLNELFAHLATLQIAAEDYYEALAALNQRDVTRNEVFRVGSERIVAVLREFKRQAESSLREVRSELDGLRAQGYLEVAERAKTGVGFLAEAGADHWVGETANRMGDLRQWFSAGGAIDGLIDSAVAGIKTLLAAIERRHRARQRGCDPAADFRAVARMIHAQPGPQQANRVFAAATGMWPSRHLNVDGVDRAESPSWRIKARPMLRAYEGSGLRRAKQQRIDDVDAAREAEALAEARELARLEAIAESLATAEPVGLEHFQGLSADAAETLSDLVEEALEAYEEADASGYATTPFCDVQVWVVQPPRVVRVEWDEGSLVTFDLRIWIRPIADIDADMRYVGAAA